MITSRLHRLFPILLLSLLTACAGTVKPEPVAEAVQVTLGEDLDSLEAGWQEFVKRGGPLKAMGRQ